MIDNERETDRWKELDTNLLHPTYTSMPYRCKSSRSSYKTCNKTLSSNEYYKLLRRYSNLSNDVISVIIDYLAPKTNHHFWHDNIDFTRIDKDIALEKVKDAIVKINRFTGKCRKCPNEKKERECRNCHLCERCCRRLCKWEYMGVDRFCFSKWTITIWNTDYEKAKSKLTTAEIEFIEQKVKSGHVAVLSTPALAN